MDLIRGNNDRCEPILRKIASNSFFPNPLPRGKLLMCYVGISANEDIRNVKYLNCGEIDKDMIDHHSWPEFFSSGFICTTA